MKVWSCAARLGLSSSQHSTASSLRMSSGTLKPPPLVGGERPIRARYAQLRRHAHAQQPAQRRAAGQPPVDVLPPAASASRRGGAQLTHSCEHPIKTQRKRPGGWSRGGTGRGRCRAPAAARPARRAGTGAARRRCRPRAAPARPGRTARRTQQTRPRARPAPRRPWPRSRRTRARPGQPPTARPRMGSPACTRRSRRTSLRWPHRRAVAK